MVGADGHDETAQPETLSYDNFPQHTSLAGLRIGIPQEYRV